MTTETAENSITAEEAEKALNGAKFYKLETYADGDVRFMRDNRRGQLRFATVSPCGLVNGKRYTTAAEMLAWVTA